MAIRIKKSVCVGLDVHRNNVWACVCAKDPNKKKDTLVFKTKKFLSNHTDLTEMCNWIKETTEKILGKQVTEPIDVYMESTGKYSTLVYDVCEQNKTKPHIVNPKHVRTIAGQKTDQKDCAWIAELGINGLLRESYIPEKAIRASRRLSRSRTNILHAQQDDVRRIQNVLTEANIRMDLIFTSIDGESARKVVEYLMETDEPKLGEIKRRIRKSCRIMKYESVEERKKKEEELLKAFSGAKFSPEQKFELRKAYERIDSYNAQIRDYETMMNETLLPFKSYLDLLESVPGISRLSAMQIVSEIGPDMEPFQNEKSFISWCGLCPQSNKSNNKHKSVKIGKGGKYLKPVLVQCALNAIKHPYYSGKYEAISRRRCKKIALIAIARKMMVAVYHMFMTGEYFNPTELLEEDDQVVSESVDSEQSTVDSEQLKKEEAIEQTAQELVAMTMEKDPEVAEKVQFLLEQLGIGATFQNGPLQRPSIEQRRL